MKQRTEIKNIQCAKIKSLGNFVPHNDYVKSKVSLDAMLQLETFPFLDASLTVASST